MTRHISIAEFKDHLSELIAAVQAGDEIVITRHGKAAAKVVPMVDDDALRRQREAATERIRAHVARMRAEGRTATIDELIAWKNEGRR
ncbi:MAG: type II toxin-antitoxin system Phd/YefM family antitoxin [Sphingomicrobium sp.]|jgi:prevent-host-death family protein